MASMRNAARAAEAYLRDHPTATYQEIALVTGCSGRTARRVRAAYREISDLSRMCFAATLRGLDDAHDEANEQVNPLMNCGKEDATLLLYDIHLPYESEKNVEIALSYAETHYNINCIVLGGDLLDCHKISRWRKDPFAGMPFHEEVAYAVCWLESLVKMFPRAGIVLVKGNHEDRLQQYLWNQAPEISRMKGMTIQEQLELDRLGIEWVDNLEYKRKHGRFWGMGKLNILHGHELGICPSVNPARQYFLRGLENMVMGHVHKVDDHYANTINDDTKGAFVVGCLCDMHPDYRPQNDWVAGFGICTFEEPMGHFSMELKKIIDGRVL